MFVCGYVNGGGENIFIKKNSLTDVQAKHYAHQTRLRNNVTAFKNGETRTKKLKSKRGIVMVDSDFDIPSEIYSYESNLHTGDVFGKNEGSGTNEFDEKESGKTTRDNTKLQPGYNGITNTATTENSSKVVAPKRENESNVSVTDGGSGDEIFTIDNSTAESSTWPEYETIPFEFITETSTQSKYEIPYKNFTEIATEIWTQPDYDVQEIIPDICMNSACGTEELFITSSEERLFIPEGANFTLTCISKGSNHNSLSWYKSNGSVYFLQTLGSKAELHFNVPDTKTTHSGTYACVKWVNKNTCCNVQSNVTIYEVPLYRYHLIIIGIITATCLLICIFLTVRQSIALKIYTRHFAEKHGNVKNQLV